MSGHGNIGKHTPNRLERERAADWSDFGSCRDNDPELWFPVSNIGLGRVQADRAKAICGRCPVTTQCLEAALTKGIGYGIWGGATEQERQQMRGGKPDYVCPDCGNVYRPRHAGQQRCHLCLTESARGYESVAHMLAEQYKTRMRDWKADGLTDSEIAERIGYSKYTIGRARALAGIVDTYRPGGTRRKAAAG